MELDTALIPDREGVSGSNSDAVSARLHLQQFIAELKNDLREFRLSSALDDTRADEQFISAVIDRILRKDDDEIMMILTSPAYQKMLQLHKTICQERSKDQASDDPCRTASQEPEGSGNSQSLSLTSSPTEELLDDPLQEIFGEQYNSSNGSLLLLILGLFNMGEGALIGMITGDKVKAMMIAGIGSAMLLVAEQWSNKGENTPAPLHWAGYSLLLLDSLITLYGSFHMALYSHELYSNMTDDQKKLLQRWLRRYDKFTGQSHSTSVTPGLTEVVPSSEKLPLSVDGKVPAKISLDTEAARVQRVGKVAGAGLGVFSALGFAYGVFKMFNAYSTMKTVENSKKNKGLSLTELRQYDQAGQDFMAKLQMHARRINRALAVYLSYTTGAEDSALQNR
ncbi:MAG: hypothetical protein H6618_08935 [Deltaproteobacteria bacterium]|nr:hypothetical protein [Deltaproteobacteria bacterium]